jgi:DivIVA domain-containing protein
MDISALRFTPRFLWNGYDQVEVDQFLALAAASLALPLAERPMLPEQAADVRFTVMRFHPGYSVKQVDKALIELGVALGQPAQSGSPGSPEEHQNS